MGELLSLTCKSTERSTDDELNLSSSSLYQELVRFSEPGGYKKSMALVERLADLTNRRRQPLTRVVGGSGNLETHELSIKISRCFSIAPLWRISRM